MEQVKHIAMLSPNGAKLNLDALYQIAPSCFTEAKGEKKDCNYWNRAASAWKKDAERTSVWYSDTNE